MATDAKFAEYVREQIRSSTPSRIHKMFGEYALYLGDKTVALICDDSVFLKPTEPGRALIGRPTLGPPYPGAKMFFVVDEFLDDAPFFTRLVETTAAALPAPKVKKPAAKKTAVKKPAAKKTAAKKSVAKKPAAKKKSR